MDVLDVAAAEQPIRTIMKYEPVTVEQHDSLREVARELTAGEIGVLLVSSPVGPVGLISERDIVNVVAIGGDIERAAPTDSIAAVGRLMVDAGVRHVVIRSDNGRVIGVVSVRDVLDAVLA